MYIPCIILDKTDYIQCVHNELKCDKFFFKLANKRWKYLSWICIHFSFFIFTLFIIRIFH